MAKTVEMIEIVRMAITSPTALIAKIPKPEKCLDDYYEALLKNSQKYGSFNTIHYSVEITKLVLDSGDYQICVQ